jgi:Spy/CpxP family protein refolding chaperone
MIVLHGKTHAAINQVLTPEQRQKMQAHFRSHLHRDDGDDSQS